MDQIPVPICLLGILRDRLSRLAIFILAGLRSGADFAMRWVSWAISSTEVTPAGQIMTRRVLHQRKRDAEAHEKCRGAQRHHDQRLFPVLVQIFHDDTKPSLRTWFRYSPISAKGTNRRHVRLVCMPVKYLFAAAVGSTIGLLFVFTSDMFADTAMLWLMALLALIAGAKLGIFACYLFDLANGNAPNVFRSRE
jgi:hypothetical protein